MNTENTKSQFSPLLVDSTLADEELKRIQGRFSPVSVLLITITGIAVAEIIAMIVVYFYRYLPYYQQVLIDASVMTVIIFPILYYLSFRPILQHIERRYQVEKEVRAREQKERELLQTIYTMQLDIARDLHDTVGQNISFLRLKLDYLGSRKSIRKSDLQAEIQSMRKAAQESYDLMRGTLAVLQSGTSSDLFRVFSRYAEQIQERTELEIGFVTQGDAQPLSAKRMRQLFFVFREALNNIEKHANATRVSATIDWQLERLLFTIADDGKGFDTSSIEYSMHYGLKFMRDRVEMLSGTIDIQSVPGTGTKIMIKVPYE